MSTGVDGTTARVRRLYDQYAERYDRDTDWYDRVMLGSARRAVCGQARGQVMDVTISPTSFERWPSLENLFGRTGGPRTAAGAHRRIGPRYRDRPRADNKRGLWQLATSGQLPGLLVFDADLAVGWCELAPRA